MVTTLAWTLTLTAIGGLLALDVLVSARRTGAVQFREAVSWSVFYIAAALAFGVVLGGFAGWDLASQYFAGYVVEKSLSIDNLFVFVIIIAAFAVPVEHRSRALTIGITLALILRAIFIALGAALVEAFSFMFVIFGVVLIATAVQLLRHRHQDLSIEDNPLVVAARRALPVTDRYHGARLITQIAGRRYVTPMLLVLLAIGTTDMLFALDSIPAVFGVTRHPYIVFCANAFALLGLRALFFLVTGLLDRLIYLSVGLSAILAFIGVKLVLHFIHLHSAAIPEISTAVSLAVILAVLITTAVTSLIISRARPNQRAHAGSLRSASPARKTSRPIEVTEPDDPAEGSRRESTVTSARE
ncbi:MAG: TerC/Alx family metal homeostasis membrane protein [Solirubrobacteraceae bacterium]